jgi:hypothetical protein
VGRIARNTSAPDSGPTSSALPLRWALIFTVATAVGLTLGYTVDLIAGVTVGLGITGLLHKILAPAPTCSCRRIPDN